MSTNAPDSEFVSLASRLRDALIEKGKLTPDGAVRIEEMMRAERISYADAAIQLGLITPFDLLEANEAAEQTQPKSREGIMEGALYKVAFNRGLPVKYVGTVKAGPSLILLNSPESGYSEQIRALRTELMLLNRATRTGNVLAVLSPCKGEGRTQLCAELAIAFSQLNQSTLLVDADLRRPRMHTLFQAVNAFADQGLGSALASSTTPELLSVEQLPHLSVLMAGPTIANPLESLTNGNLHRQMADWRKRYRMVIIDTPPITDYADGLAIASLADQVVVVSRSGSTPHKNIKEMLRRMGATQSRIVGSVINSF